MTEITAQLIEHEKAEAEGHKVRSYTPVFALCRKLIEAGFDSSRPLHAYRGDTLCLTVRSIGEGARLTVGDDSKGVPRFRPYRDPDDPRKGPRYPLAPTSPLHTLAGTLNSTDHHLTN